MTVQGTPAPIPDATARRGEPEGSPNDLDRSIARLLTIGSYLGVTVLTVGVVSMAIAGRSPLSPGFPALDLTRLPGDLAAGRAEGFLWLGLLAVISTPTARVVASLVGYARLGERRMVLVSLAILAVIATSVGVGLLSVGGGTA